MIKKLRPLLFGLFLVLFAAPIWADMVEIDLTATPNGGNPPAPELVFDTIAGLPGLTLTVTSPWGGNVTQTATGLGSDLVGNSALTHGEVLRFQFDPEMFVHHIVLRDPAGQGLWFVSLNVAMGDNTPGNLLRSGPIGNSEFQITINTLANTIDITATSGGEFRVGTIAVSPVPEPASLLLFGSGLIVGVAGLREKLKK